MKSFRREDFRFTVINSTGGITQETNLCLLVGFSQERLSFFLELVRKNCHHYTEFIPSQGVMPPQPSAIPMVEAELGGAMIYMMNVVRFEQI